MTDNMNSQLGLAIQITIWLMDRNLNDGLDNGTFNDQTTLNPLNTGLVHYSDPTVV